MPNRSLSRQCGGGWDNLLQARESAVLQLSSGWLWESPPQGEAVALAQGLIRVYTRDGKGKTTAALGLALRAASHGLEVEVVQFMKGWMGYDELKGVERLLTVAIHPFGRGG